MPSGAYYTPWPSERKACGMIGKILPQVESLLQHRLLSSKMQMHTCSYAACTQSTWGIGQFHRSIRVRLTLHPDRPDAHYRLGQDYIIPDRRTGANGDRDLSRSTSTASGRDDRERGKR